MQFSARDLFIYEQYHSRRGALAGGGSSSDLENYVFSPE
jgi:hypothetical protein